MEVHDQVSGQLLDDGTLQLDRRPLLAPGAVTVSIHRTAPVRTSILDVLQKIDESQRARGFTGTSAEELLERERERIEEQEYHDQLRTMGSPPTGS